MFPVVELFSTKNDEMREALSSIKSIISSDINRLVEVERLEKYANNINYDIVELTRILIDHPDMVVEDKFLAIQNAMFDLEEKIIMLHFSVAQ
jgi:hypothetical protein